jgi:hypothetical protein
VGLGASQRYESGWHCSDSRSTARVLRRLFIRRFGVRAPGDPQRESVVAQRLSPKAVALNLTESGLAPLHSPITSGIRGIRRSRAGHGSGRRLPWRRARCGSNCRPPAAVIARRGFGVESAGRQPRRERAYESTGVRSVNQSVVAGQRVMGDRSDCGDVFSSVAGSACRRPGPARSSGLLAVHFDAGGLPGGADVLRYSVWVLIEVTGDAVDGGRAGGRVRGQPPCAGADGRVVQLTSAPLHPPNTATCLSHVDATLDQVFLQVPVGDRHLRCQRTAPGSPHASSGSTREPRSLHPFLER